MKNTPTLHAREISVSYVGPVELENGEYHFEIVTVSHPEHGKFLVAGSACNTGLMAEYARPWEPEEESLDSALAELIADLECVPDHASGELLGWNGSLVI